MSGTIYKFTLGAFSMDRKLLINSITINLPKNAIQFLTGIVLYITFFGIPDARTAILSCTAFLTVYSAVYVYNDITDAKEDSCHRSKNTWKLIACGLITKKQGWALYFLLLAIGFSMSLFVNIYFTAIMASLIGLNFLHSSPRFRFKKSLRKTAVNMTVIEFLKYASGWFALTGNISVFPFWVVVLLSISYNIGYILYKSERKGDYLRDNKKFFASMGLIALSSYFLSFFAYGIPLAMILMLIIPSTIITLLRYVNIEYESLKGTFPLTMIFILAVFLSSVLVFAPPIADANEKIAYEIGSYTKSVKQKMPEPIISGMDEIKAELDKYEDLDQIVGEINDSLVNLTNRSLLP